jgi:hypothetical protein
MPETNPDGTPSVKSRVPQPPGVLPRNLQTWLVFGLAAVMIAVILFASGRQAPPRQPVVPPPAPVTEPNETRIRELRARIDEGVRRLTAEQARIAEAKENLGLAGAGAAGRMPLAARPDIESSIDRYRGYCASPSRDAIEEDPKRSEDRSSRLEYRPHLPH